ncbi:MAG TPA: T9SS type A sorting domain-containing protein, partial [Bacteroidia bacterium]|nr:T9SS type A sorting domain-containing protein [Bacteroidia bacterium]
GSITTTASDYTNIITDASGAPVIVFTNHAHTAYSVMRYDGSNFSALGTTPVSPTAVQCPSLAADATGTIYLGYSSSGAYTLEYSCLTTGIVTNSKPVSSWKAFPNPSSGDVIFQAPEIRVETSFILYNANGELVRTLQLNDLQTTVKREGLASGIYFYRILTAGRMAAQGKLIFQ